MRVEWTAGEDEIFCHTTITNGRIYYWPDSTHEMAGQTRRDGAVAAMTWGHWLGAIAACAECLVVSFGAGYMLAGPALLSPEHILGVGMEWLQQREEEIRAEYEDKQAVAAAREQERDAWRDRAESD